VLVVSCCNSHLHFFTLISSHFTSPGEREKGGEERGEERKRRGKRRRRKRKEKEIKE
jgi:hypothetical protein